MIGATIRFTLHAQERMATRGYAPGEIYEAIGSEFADGTGRLTIAKVGAGLVRPAPGAPVRLGVQHCFNEPRHLLLGVSSSGRQVHASVVLRARLTLVVVTVWDPADPEQPGAWRSDGLAPTELGKRLLPPTHWYALAA